MNPLTRAVITGITVAVGAVGYGAAVAPQAHGDTVQPVIPSHLPGYMTRPCPAEDSVNCYWDASKTGSGTGHSFYSIPGKRGYVCTVYWAWADHHWNNCQHV